MLFSKWQEGKVSQLSWRESEFSLLAEAAEELDSELAELVKNHFGAIRNIEVIELKS